MLESLKKLYQDPPGLSSTSLRMVASENVKKCSLALAPESLNDVVLICSLLIRNEFFLLHVCSSVFITYIEHVFWGKEYIVFTFFFLLLF